MNSPLVNFVKKLTKSMVRDLVNFVKKLTKSMVRDLPLKTELKTDTR